MANIRRRPSGSWQATVYVGTVDGKKHYEYITRATRQECKAAATELEAEVGLGKYKISSNITLGEAMDTHIKNIESVLSPTTIGLYRGYSKHALSAMSNQYLKQLTSEYIQMYYATELKSKSPKTIKNIHGFLNQVLDRFLGYKNPCKDVKLPKAVKYIPTTLSNEQLSILLKKLNGHLLEIPVLLALLCGMRRGEVLGLRWSDVDFSTRKVSIRQTKVYSEGKYHIKSPKSYAGTRDVYIPDYLRTRLIKEYEKSRFTSEVFVLPNMSAYISDAFQEMMQSFKLPVIRFHDLRHMYAALMMSLGVPDLYTSTALGNGDRSITKIYQHILDDEHKQAALKIDKLLSQIG